jgi:hypothetical protein
VKLTILDEEAKANRDVVTAIWELPEIQNQILMHPDDEMVPLLQLVSEALDRLKKEKNNG